MPRTKQASAKQDGDQTSVYLREQDVLTRATVYHRLPTLEAYTDDQLIKLARVLGVNTDQGRSALLFAVRSVIKRGTDPDRLRRFASMCDKFSADTNETDENEGKDKGQ